jgi:endonuclease-3
MNDTTTQKKQLAIVKDLLVDAYGRREWKQRLDPISELVQTILSQNTSDSNSGKAFNSLRIAFPSWDGIITASEPAIAHAIREGGLSKVKANYIKNCLIQIKKEGGGFDLSFLKDMMVHEAREWLMRLPGVGMKTASCVLLFSLGMPAFPVDTHVLRVARRLAIIPVNTGADEAHILLESLTPVRDVYEMHMLLIAHGRSQCKAQHPRCRECPLSTVCPGRRDDVIL